MRRSLALALAALAAAPATADAQQTGGTEYVPGPLLSTPAFKITPARIAPGATLTLRYRIAGKAGKAYVRVDLLASDGTRAATRSLGRRRIGRRLTARWRPELEPGSYTARLRATVASGGTARSSTRRFEVTAPAVVAAPGIFPVRGPYSLGGDQARFGAGRPGHSHQGQDIMAAAGTPVVSPRPGTVTWRAFQADGAGHYLVVRVDDGRDMVFMHFQDGSVLVRKGQTVAAGQQLGRVGSTGRSDGPHLHLEIWPDGWYAGNGSAPIDPLADLLAWAG
ncbi:MAG TPA: M23 family metallopeptidase [Solirubrobacteraceae bacterium]|nr:M23 family metallopeptidase [Solirubrobacteraceae bacterium]